MSPVSPFKCLRDLTDRVTGVHLKGELNGWATPKDLILHVAGRLTVRVRKWLLGQL